MAVDLGHRGPGTGGLGRATPMTWKPSMYQPSGKVWPSNSIVCVGILLLENFWVHWTDQVEKFLCLMSCNRSATVRLIDEQQNMVSFLIFPHPGQDCVWKSIRFAVQLFCWVWGWNNDEIFASWNILRAEPCSPSKRVSGGRASSLLFQRELSSCLIGYVSLLFMKILIKNIVYENV